MDGVDRVHVGAFVLTVSWASAVHRSAGDPAALAFVVGSYLAMLLLLYCLRALHRTPPGRGRGRLKAAVLALTAILTAMFFGKVGAAMPLWTAVAFWAMSTATVAAVFLALCAGAEAAR